MNILNSQPWPGFVSNDKTCLGQIRHDISIILDVNGAIPKNIT